MSNPPDPQTNVVNMPAVMRLRAVVQRTGLSRSTIYRLMDAGEFPRSFKIGKTASGWLEAEVRAWINNCARARHRADRDVSSAAA